MAPDRGAQSGEARHHTGGPVRCLLDPVSPWQPVQPGVRLSAIAARAVRCAGCEPFLAVVTGITGTHGRYVAACGSRPDQGVWLCPLVMDSARETGNEGSVVNSSGQHVHRVCAAAPTAGGGAAPDSACQMCAVELPRAQWRKSSRSTYSGACLEFAQISGDLVGVRDSKAGDVRPVITFGVGEWREFVSRVRNGEYDNLA